MSGEHIQIGVELKLVGDTANTIRAVNQFSHNIRELNELATKFGGSLISVSDQMWKIGNAAVKVDEVLKSTGLTTGKLNEKTKELNSVTRFLGANLRLEKVILAEDTMRWTKFNRAITSTFEEVEPGGTKIRQLAESLDRFAGSTEWSDKMFKEIAKGFSQTGPQLTLPIVKGLYEVSENTVDFIYKLRDVQKIISETGISSRQLEGAVKGGVDGIKRFATEAATLRDRLAEMKFVQQKFMADLGVMGLFLKNTARTLFWAGLGGMFFFMSLSRVQRMELQVKSATLGLVRANIAYSDALEQVRRYQQYGITNGKAYRDAQINLWEAELNLALAEDRLVSATQERIYSYLQLAFGTVPTLMRTLDGLNDAQKMHAILTNLDSVSTDTNSIAKVRNAIATRLMAMGIGEANAQLLAFITLSAAATAGITLLGAGIASIIAQRQLSDQMEEANKKFKELGITMRKRASPPMYEMFTNFGKSLEYSTRNAKSLTSALSGTIAGTGGLSNAVHGGRNITINIYGNWSVRDDRDISLIGRDIASRLSNRGAPI